MFFKSLDRVSEGLGHIDIPPYSSENRDHIFRPESLRKAIEALALLDSSFSQGSILLVASSDFYRHLRSWRRDFIDLTSLKEQYLRGFYGKISCLDPSFTVGDNVTLVIGDALKDSEAYFISAPQSNYAPEFFPDPPYLPFFSAEEEVETFQKVLSFPDLAKNWFSSARLQEIKAFLRVGSLTSVNSITLEAMQDAVNRRNSESDTSLDGKALTILQRLFSLNPSAVNDAFNREMYFNLEDVEDLPLVCQVVESDPSKVSVSALGLINSILDSKLTRIIDNESGNIVGFGEL